MALLMLVGTVALSGCASSHKASRDHRDHADTPAPQAATQRPAPILHMVFIRLRDPLDTAAASRDCLETAERIPSITSAFAGLHLDTGRESIVRDYDVCFTLGFADRAGLEAYVVHPEHVALVERWGSRIEWLRIYDAQDVRP